MVKLKEAVVVEGKYDVNTLRQVVDAPVFHTDGFRSMKNPELIALLKAAARKRGLVILTDSDGAGFLIRNTLKNALQGEHVLHAYIPDVAGKERRKTVPSKEGKLGVEGMRPDVLLAALERAGATIDGTCRAKSGMEITNYDLYSCGLSGKSDSAKRRKELLGRLGLPAHLRANGLLQALNLLFTKDEFSDFIQRNSDD